MTFGDTGAFIARYLPRDSLHSQALDVWRGERLYGSERLEIIFSDRDDEIATLQLFRKFADQKVSFTDCVSFALMRNFGIETAFTFDRHFLRAGLRVIGVKQ